MKPAPYGRSSLEPLLTNDGGRAFVARVKGEGGTIVRVAVYRTWNTELPDWRQRLHALAETCVRERVRLRVVLLDQAWNATRPGFADWTLRVAREYPTIREWVIWNEPNSHIFWHGTPAQYGALLRDAHRALVLLDPTLRISAFGLATSHSPLRFLANARPFPPCILSIHPYGNAPMLFVRNVRAASSLPIDIDECAWPASSAGDAFIAAARLEPHVASVLRWSPP